MSDAAAAGAVGADSLLRQPGPAARAARSDTVMSFLIVARHSLPERRRISKPNNDKANSAFHFEKTRPGNKRQIPNSKHQRSTKLQPQKPTCAPFASASVFGIWCSEIWSFSGAWGLVRLVFRSAVAQKLGWVRTIDW